MSDELKHECGVVLLRLRKNASHYDEFFGLQKIALLLEKQHNRGQDGAGIASLKIEATPGKPYYQLTRSNQSNPLGDVLNKIWEHPFDGDVLLGHLRYGTFGNNGISACHPVLKESVCRSRTLLLAGNFNLTNNKKLFKEFTKKGHHLFNTQDTSILLHSIGHELEKALEKKSGNSEKIKLEKLLATAAKKWDGGFVISGILGDGRSFAFRDSAGIRPAFYHVDDNIIVVSSERPAIQTAFDVKYSDVHELPPGHVIIIEKDGSYEIKECLKKREIRSCIFERVYFSRGNDAEIQQERRKMGKLLTPQVLKAVDNDLDNSFFSYIPNTAQISFHGLLDELLHYKNIRFGLLVIKDAKFRTFISNTAKRKSLDMHVYDIVYGLVKPKKDNIVVIDDSIVRGTTMKNLILRILDRLEPKKIVIVSAAPPICYPDCYGIDMASLKELIAFQAAVSLLKKHNKEDILYNAYQLAKKDLEKKDSQMENRVCAIYNEFTFEELCKEIGELLTHKAINAEVEVVFQHLDDLRKCCPNHSGDWYFSGNYPTPGGNRVVNQSLVNYVEKIDERAY